MPTLDSETAGKRPFDIDEVIARLRDAVQPYPPAAMFQLAAEGFSTPFEQLVACIFSIRTRDEVSLVVARRLFAMARTPEQIAALPVAEIDRLIAASTFHEPKAAQIRTIAHRIIDEFDGDLP